MGVIIFRRGAARTAREIRVLNEKVANKQNSREFRQKPAAAEDGQGGKGGGGRDRRMESSEHGRAWPHRLLSYQKPHYRCNYRAKNITRDGGGVSERIQYPSYEPRSPPFVRANTTAAIEDGWRKNHSGFFRDYAMLDSESAQFQNNQFVILSAPLSRKNRAGLYYYTRLYRR